jgi:hypothetical protein
MVGTVSRDLRRPDSRTVSAARKIGLQARQGDCQIAARHHPVESAECRGTVSSREEQSARRPEKRREFHRKWRAANREKLRAASQKRRTVNLDHIRETERAYREANRERIRANRRKQAKKQAMAKQRGDPDATG